MKQLQLDLEQKKPPVKAEESVKKSSSQPKVFSVSELNKKIRGLLESQFTLVWVQGEISNFKAHTSGHYYFSLKDSKSQINAVMFRGYNSHLKFTPETGMEVIVRGKVSVYEPRGNYQVFAETMEPVGAGALQKAFEQLKSKLQKQGLFDASRKKPLPSFPKHIAVVTSPTGAAIRDILNVLRRRHCGVPITVVPALVQGAGSAPSIVKGLQLANRIKDVDVIIVGRGGGSMEDLWAFNEEAVARAIVASEKPVISAVGHEVDFTIADFVSDLRAPTPSAAAELVVKNKSDLIDKISNIWNRLLHNQKNIFRHYNQIVQHLSRRLVDPKRRLQDYSIRCDELTQRLELSILRNIEMQKTEIALLRQKLSNPLDNINKIRQNIKFNFSRMQSLVSSLLEDNKAQLKNYMSLLDSLSPLKVVERGYSIVTQNSRVIKDIKQIKKGDLLDLQFAKGHAKTKVEEILKD